MTEAADFVVDTTASTPAQIARRIVGAMPSMPDLPARPEVAAKPSANGKTVQKAKAE
jgi:hypothetical protein